MVANMWTKASATKLLRVAGILIPALLGAAYIVVATGYLAAFATLFLLAGDTHPAVVTTLHLGALSGSTLTILTVLVLACRDPQPSRLISLFRTRGEPRHFILALAATATALLARLVVLAIDAFPSLPGPDTSPLLLPALGAAAFFLPGIALAMVGIAIIGFTIGIVGPAHR